MNEILNVLEEIEYLSRPPVCESASKSTARIRMATKMERMLLEDSCNRSVDSHESFVQLLENLQIIEGSGDRLLGLIEEPFDNLEVLIKETMRIMNFIGDETELPALQNQLKELKMLEADILGFNNKINKLKNTKSKKQILVEEIARIDAELDSLEIQSCKMKDKLANWNELEVEERMVQLQREIKELNEIESAMATENSALQKELEDKRKSDSQNSFKWMTLGEFDLECIWNSCPSMHQNEDWERLVLIFDENKDCLKRLLDQLLNVNLLKQKQNELNILHSVINYTFALFPHLSVQEQNNYKLIAHLVLFVREKQPISLDSVKSALLDLIALYVPGTADANKQAMQVLYLLVGKMVLCIDRSSTDNLVSLS